MVILEGETGVEPPGVDRMVTDRRVETRKSFSGQTGFRFDGLCSARSDLAGSLSQTKSSDLLFCFVKVFF